MSQSTIILEALKRGEALTKLDAMRMGAGLSINSRVADLRAQGYDISCTCESRDGKKVWVYRLNGPRYLADPEWVGDREDFVYRALTS